jgi:hypothetical protein
MDGLGQQHILAQRCIELEQTTLLKQAAGDCANEFL